MRSGIHPGRRRALVRTLALSVLFVASSGAGAREEFEPDLPAAFLPGGLLGVQVGGAWEESRKSRPLTGLSCEAVEPRAEEAKCCSCGCRRNA